MRQDDLYEQVTAEFGAALDRLARSYEADADKRRDLLQEIHFAIWRSFGEFGGDCSLRTWVYRVAHNVAASHVSGISAPASVRWSVSMTSTKCRIPSIRRRADRQQALDRLREFIQQLKPIERKSSSSISKASTRPDRRDHRYLRGQRGDEDPSHQESPRQKERAMSDELELWQSQSAESTRLTAGTLKEMEKKMRRNIYDFYAAMICIAIVIVGIAALFRNVTLTSARSSRWAVSDISTYEVISGLRGVPSPVGCVDRLPARVDAESDRIPRQSSLAARRRAHAGRNLFFLGFAAALPKLAPFIYLQLATFLVAIALMVPMNKRAAVRLQRRLDELNRIQ